MPRPTATEVIVPIFTAMIGLFGGLAIALPTYWGNNRQMDVKMVEIAVGILSAEPKDNITPAREWAVEVIDHYSEVKLAADVKTSLIKFRTIWADNSSSSDSSSNWSSNWPSADKSSDKLQTAKPKPEKN
jgi:hypothetical protein